MYVSNPTWGNHILMGKTAGFTVKAYKYYDAATKSVNFEGLKQDLEVLKSTLTNQPLKVNQ